MIMAIRFIEIQKKKQCLWKKWDKSLADMMKQEGHDGPGLLT